MKKLALVAGASFALLSTNPILASTGDPVAGKALHDEANCLRCHAAQPYDPNKSDTFAKLVNAVSFCNVNLNTGWFDDEVEDVAAFLNQEYYKLKN